MREATDVEGHAVRQLYLLAAVADLATETDDPNSGPRPSGCGWR